MTRIRLSEHFTYGKLVRFVFPSIMMMIFTSIYGMVDGLFVSNFVGKTSFAAINLIDPLAMVISSVGFMIGAGGSAIIGKTLGEGQKDKANRYFSMLILVEMIAGIVFAVLGTAFLRPIVVQLGAEGNLLDDCIRYGRIILLSLPFFMLQTTFQSFFVTAEKPRLGLVVIVLSGVANMVLDALFILVFRWGLFGAAFATALSRVIGGLIPILYFAFPNDSLLRLTKAEFYPQILWKSCMNGSSEMVSNIANSFVALLYNYQLMRLLGENGVAAYGVIMYISFIFSAIHYGYAMGLSPVVSFQHGAENHEELKNLHSKSLLLVNIAGAVMFLTVKLVSSPMSKIFVGYDAELMGLTVYAFNIFAYSFLLSGMNTFASAFFTALNDGAISAILAFMRTFLFKVFSILWLPVCFGLDGLWGALAVSEAVSLIVTLYFLISRRKKYHYA